MNKKWVQRSILASVVLLFAIFTNSFGVIAQDSPFHWEYINVNIAVQQNGDMLVTETQKYVFDRDHKISRIIFKNIGFLLLGFSYSMVVWIPWGIIVMLRRFCPNCKGWKLERKVKVLVPTTTEASGMQQVTHHCSNCSYHRQYSETIIESIN